MRNLKKILAMVLALIMSLSLMATAGAADFPDADKISEDYTVAVEVLNGLGVFKGYESGNFEPQGNITRAEVAAIIYRIATGDVNDAQTGIYSSWGMFEDVKDGQWYAGYVNYCANAGYIKGYNNRFDPNAQVTGYQALAMILRAVGYDKMGEFTGSNWQVNTASTARERGVLQNVSSGLLGQSATREMIAEILFRAILIDKVNYTPALGYQVADTSVGYDSLGLEDLSGVVTGNEYADLYGSAPMKDGQTRLNVDGTDYVLETGSVLTDIGERRHAYVTDKGANVLYHLYDAETDYTVAEPANDGGEGDTVADVARSQGLKLTDTTEYFVNFGDPIDKYTSDYRMEYKVGLNVTRYEIMALLYSNGGTAMDKDGNIIRNVDQTAWDAFRTSYEGAVAALDTDVNWTYDKAIKVGEEITAQDMIFIREIFYGSDNGQGVFDDRYDIYFGEVYVATKSQVDNLGNSVDISDEISYREFMDRYINDEFKDFSASDNGEWLKIVDYDQDGNADYVMRTDFVMTTTVDHNTKTDVWFVEYLDRETGEYTEIPSADVSGKEALAFPNGDMKLVSAANLVEGQVYMYTYIDGVYYITEPAHVDDLITAIDYKKETVTSASTTYGWSGIDKKAIQYYTDIAEVDKNVEYKFYLDQFGYIRLFTQTDKGFVLLTDGYFATDRRDNQFKAQIWDDGEKVDIEVVSSNDYPATTFIWSAADREDNAIYHDDEGTWQRLKEFGHVYYAGNAYPTMCFQGHWADVRSDLVKSGSYGYVSDPYQTNIAAYTEKDGKYTLGTVNMADTSRAIYAAFAIDNTDYMVDHDETNGNGTVYSDDRTLYGVTEWNSDGTVKTSENVRIQTTTDTLYYYLQNDGKIVSWSGYNSADAPARFQVKKAYAVTSYVPDRESNNANPLPYRVAEIVVIEGTYVKNPDKADFLYGLVAGRTNYWLGETSEGYDDYSDTRRVGTDVNSLINFYDRNTGILIVDDFQKYGIYAGRVVTYDRVKGRNYVQVSVNKSDVTGRRDANLNYGEPTFDFYTDEIPMFNLTYNLAQKNDALRAYTPNDDSNLSLGDYVIYMVDANGDVGMLINVSESKDTDKNAIPALDALWNSISDWQKWYYATTPFTFYGRNRVDNPSIAVSTLSAAESFANANGGATYGGSIKVSYEEAVAAGTNHWIAPVSTTNYKIYKYNSGWSNTTMVWPGIPTVGTPGGFDDYIVIVDGTWYYLQQGHKGTTTYGLKSNDTSKVIVDNTNSAAPVVIVFDTNLTLSGLQSILDTTIKGGKVTVTANSKTNNSVYWQNMDTNVLLVNQSNYDINVLVNGGVAASTSTTTVKFGDSTYAQVFYDTNVVEWVSYTDAKGDIANGEWILKSTANLYIKLKSGSNSKVTGVDFGTVQAGALTNADYHYALSSVTGAVTIHTTGRTDADYLNEAVNALPAVGTVLTGSVLVPNYVYDTNPDTANYKTEIEKAVRIAVLNALDTAKYPNVGVKVETTSTLTMEAPNVADTDVVVKITLSYGDATYVWTNSQNVSVVILVGSATTVREEVKKKIESVWNAAGGFKAEADTLTKAQALAEAQIPGLKILNIEYVNQGSSLIPNSSVKVQYTFSYGGVIYSDPVTTSDLWLKN